MINSIIYAEVSTTYATMEEIDAVLADAALVPSEIPWPAAFLIGAHAAVLGMRLLTRDAARYRTYFPTVNSSLRLAIDRLASVRTALNEENEQQ